MKSLRLLEDSLGMKILECLIWVSWKIETGSKVVSCLSCVIAIFRKNPFAPSDVQYNVLPSEVE